MAIMAKKIKVHSLTGRIDDQLMTQSFKAVKRITSFRPLGIPAVRDRIAQEAIRGTANYFATTFSTCVKLYQKLDKWIRMRVRCMKFKRKLSYDNYRMKQRYFDKKLGLKN
jgi:hypothetical protein